MFEKKDAGLVLLTNQQRHRYDKQLVAMGEAERRKTRGVLRNATSMSLALGESMYRKIVRFRADLPSAPTGPSGSLSRNVGASGFSMSGI